MGPRRASSREEASYSHGDGMASALASCKTVRRGTESYGNCVLYRSDEIADLLWFKGSEDATVEDPMWSWHLPRSTHRTYLLLQGTQFDLKMSRFLHILSILFIFFRGPIKFPKGHIEKILT